MGLEHVRDLKYNRGEKVGCKAKQNKPLHRIECDDWEKARKYFLNATKKEEMRKQNVRPGTAEEEERPMDITTKPLSLCWGCQALNSEDPLGISCT